MITSSFLPLEELERFEHPVHINYAAARIPEFGLGFCAGLDLGKRRHPSHLAVLLPIRNRIYQVGSVWFDSEPYTNQLAEIKRLFRLYNIQCCHYDSTRSELDIFAERNELPSEMTGLIFSADLKYKLATKLELALERQELILLPDERQKKSILQVSNSLESDESDEIGHGEAFWSIALALDAAASLGWNQPVPFVMPMTRRKQYRASLR